MPLLNRLSEEEIKSEFTHYANLHGVPIYFNVNDNAVCTRNWVPDLFLDIGECLFALFVQIMLVEDPMYAIKIKGEIK